MKKSFICYVDMDGVLNLFEKDKNARINMYKPGYFENIPVREGIADILIRINKEAYVVILSKVINRIGVTKEKNNWLEKNIPREAYSDVIFVPYDRSKAEFLVTYYPAMLIDDKESNLDECERKGCKGLFLSDIKRSQKYKNVEDLEDIYLFYKKMIEEYSL